MSGWWYVCLGGAMVAAGIAVLRRESRVDPGAMIEMQPLPG